jgi:hypothetical protein
MSASGRSVAAVNTTTQEETTMSTKRQFTAGDWRVEPKRELENYGIVFDDGESMGIGWLADVSINLMDDDADAQVMAASKALYLALAELVALKALKDAEGKTADYEARQPAAWEAARAALALVERRA